MIDLRHEESAVWHEANVFFEAPKKNIERKTIDFGRLVQEGSEKKKAAWRRFTEKIENEMKMAERRLIKEPAFSPYSRWTRYITEKPISADKKLGGGQSYLIFKFPNFQIFSHRLLATLHLPRRVFAASLAVLILILPFPAVGYYRQAKATTSFVAEESAGAFRALGASTAAAFRADIPAAEAELQTALQSFGAVNEVVNERYGALVSLIRILPVIGSEVESRQQLLLAGHHLALGNTYLIKGIRETKDNAAMPATERIELLRRHIQGAIPQYDEALLALERVRDEAIPSEYQQTFAEFRLLFAAFIDDMKDVADLAKVAQTIFGGEGRKRYLIVFQNNHELRPSGGFIGSFARLDVERGKIVSLDVPGGGAYDLKGQLTEFVKPPLPLQLVNERWEFQDANWWPDFSASAEKMMWFYEKARGQTVDGVIAVNASVLPRVLKVLGPVASAEFGTLLDYESALGAIQEKVETGYDREKNQPKEIIRKLFEEMLAALPAVGATDLLGLLTEAEAAARQKEIQIYVSDASVQDELRQFGWTGEIVPTNAAQDYLLIASANVQGQKSDAKIEEKIRHEASVADDGSVIDTVVIRRTHTGSLGEKFYGGANISYLRVYVPEGAELLSAGGFSYPPEDAFRVPEQWYNSDPHLAAWEKDDGVHVDSGTRLGREFGKTVFGNWVITKPGETSEVYFRYRLPFKVDMSVSSPTPSSGWRTVLASAKTKATSRYSLVAQKQSGTNPNFYSRIIYPESWTPVWKSDDKMDLALNGSSLEGILETDMAIGVVMERD